MRTAVFPGSFDPITLGHVDVIRRATVLFDKIIVAIGNNTSKKYLLNFEERKEIVEKVFLGSPIEVKGYDELTIDFCRKHGADFIIRGLRNTTDFEYERNIALMNKTLNNKIESVFLIGNPDYSGVTSTIVREIYHYGGNITPFVPEEVVNALKKR
jgi:pantetheine-phosphate adenylyltransferase